MLAPLGWPQVDPSTDPMKHTARIAQDMVAIVRENDHKKERAGSITKMCAWLNFHDPHPRDVTAEILHTYFYWPGWPPGQPEIKPQLTSTWLNVLNKAVRTRMLK